MALSQAVQEWIANDLVVMTPKSWKRATDIITKAHRKWSHTGATFSEVSNIGSALVDNGVLKEKSVVRANGEHGSDWKRA